MISNFYGFTYTLPAKNDKNKSIKVNYIQSKNGYNGTIKHEQISYGDNEKYVLEYQNGDPMAMEKLAIVNARLIAMIANKYSRYQSAGFSFDDLTQSGYFGLKHAADKYDPSYGVKFSTYATWWIKNAISSGINGIGTTIKISEHKIDLVRKLKRLTTDSLDTYGYVNKEWICKKMGLNSSNYQELVRISHLRTVSTDLPTSATDTTPRINQMPSSEETVQSILENEYLKDVLMKGISQKLTKRESIVIIERFGFDGNKPKTLEEIGKEFNVSKERIRQNETRAIEKLSKFELLIDYMKE